MLGAVCPGSGQSCGLLAPHLDTAVVNLFLQQLSQQIDPDVSAVLRWDQAGFHLSRALVVPHHIRLLPLPPYSPELNPVENLWHYLKSHYWSNRCYDSYEALLDAAQHAWQQVCLCPDKIQRLCAVSYL